MEIVWTLWGKLVTSAVSESENKKRVCLHQSISRMASWFDPSHTSLVLLQKWTNCLTSKKGRWYVRYFVAMGHMELINMILSRNSKSKVEEVVFSMRLRLNNLRQNSILIKNASKFRQRLTACQCFKWTASSENLFLLVLLYLSVYEQFRLTVWFHILGVMFWCD